MAFVIQEIKGLIGFVPAVATVGAVVMLIAFIALSRLNDSYSHDLNFVER
jgi:multisubunit Na+/H+ antiporter MnhG subunit